MLHLKSTLCSTLVLATLFAPGFSAALQLSHNLPADEISSPPAVVRFLVFDSTDAALPIEVYDFPAGQYQLSPEADRVWIKAELVDELEPQSLWVELELDGAPKGERIPLAAVTSGVTFALGNNLNMDGNTITSLAQPSDPNDAATKGYVDSASITGNAETATALAVNGTNCATGSYAQGVDTQGNAEGCTADLSDDMVDSTELDNLCNSDGKFLKRMAGAWVCADGAGGAGDNLGDHVATQNIQLGSHWLSGDGGNEGIQVDANGKVGVGAAPGSADLQTGGIDGVLFQGTRFSGSIPAEGPGTRFMWYPKKAALRAGSVDGAQWDDTNIGSYSTAMGSGTTASNFGSTAMGDRTTASGYASTAMGFKTTAPSGYETVVGSYNTLYTPASTDVWDLTDRLFVIGNGTETGLESDAMVVLKNGNTGIGNSTPAVPLQVDGGTDCHFAGSSGFVKTGSTSGANICIDNNEIMASTNGVASTLFLNYDGGLTYVGGELWVNTLATATAITLCRNTDGVLASCSSSERYKESIYPLPIGLDVVEELKPVIFKWKGRDEDDLGFIAEEVAAINPLLATYDNDGQIEGVKYRQLTAVLVNAVQEQQEQIAALTLELKEYRTLAAEVASLKQSLGLVVARRD